MGYWKGIHLWKATLEASERGWCFKILREVDSKLQILCQAKPAASWTGRIQTFPHTSSQNVLFPLSSPRGRGCALSGQTVHQEREQQQRKQRQSANIRKPETIRNKPKVKKQGLPHFSWLSRPCSQQQASSRGSHPGGVGEVMMQMSWGRGPQERGLPGKQREKLKCGPDRLDLYQKFSRNAGELQRSNRIKMLETRAK